MTHRLKPHIRYALVDDQAVMLDIERDRYSLLSFEATRILRRWCEGQSSMDGMNRLAQLGLLEPGCAGSETMLPPLPTKSAVEMGRRSHSTLNFVTAVAFLARSFVTLRFRGFAAAIEIAEKRGQQSSADASEEMIAIAQAFVRYRSRLPFHDICLVESLALHHFLSRKNLAAEVVIGVRLNPFAAHCWVQSGSLVLNDSCDSISRFIPILSV